MKDLTTTSTMERLVQMSFIEIKNSGVFDCLSHPRVQEDVNLDKEEQAYRSAAKKEVASSGKRSIGPKMRITIGLRKNAIRIGGNPAKTLIG